MYNNNNNELTNNHIGKSHPTRQKETLVRVARRERYRQAFSVLLLAFLQQHTPHHTPPPFFTFTQPSPFLFLYAPYAI
jgi:hypothetical protein